jgi:type 1 glutamine amidotransferase
MLLVCSVLLLTAASVSQADAQSQPAAAKSGASKKILYLTHSAGFKHAVLPLSEQILPQLGTKAGWFSVDVTQDCAKLNAADLRQYDAVVFYTTGELPIADQQKADLQAFVEDGKGFVGIHSATDTFYKWPWYGTMIGGYFDGHPWTQKVTIKVDDPKHPSTKHLGASFEIDDEIYQFKEWSRSYVQVLLSLDPASIDLTQKGVKRTDKDFGISWTRTQGKGRVFYTALGHRPEVWQDARFQQHLVEGIRWATSR